MTLVLGRSHYNVKPLEISLDLLSLIKLYLLPGGTFRNLKFVSDTCQRTAVLSRSYTVQATNANPTYN